MKTCPICQRDYAEHMRFCTRDGTKLQAENPLNTCPECSLSFPEGINKCPVHNLELIAQAIEVANFCSLCNQYYPMADASCPIHGIALKVNSLSYYNRPSINSTNSKALFLDNNLSPVVATILEEIIRTDSLSAQSTVSDEANNLDEELSVKAQSTETNQVTHQEVVKAADTRNLTAPAVLPFDTLGQYAVDQVSADRKFLMALALIVVFSVVGFAAYSFPYALQWPKVSADTQPKTSLPPESIPNSTTTSEPTIKEANTPLEKSEEKEIVQQIEYPSAKKTSANALDKQDKLKIQNKTSQEQLKSKPLAELGKHKTLDKLNAQAKLENKQTKKASINQPKLNSKLPITTAKATANSQASVKTKDRPYKDSDSDKTARSSVNEPAKPPQTWENPISGEMRIPKRQSAKVIASVVNKSRLQTPNGYVYQFDLVVRELNGIKVRWNRTSAYKSSFSGNNNSVVSGLLGAELDANGSIQYRMAVRMTGRCIEDWYGQIVYNCSGVDENGNAVELHRILVLDNDFPTY